MPYENFATGKGYALFAKVATEQTWGGAMIGVGAFHLLTLFYLRRLYATSSVVVAMFYGAVCVLFWLANPYAIIVALAFVIGFISFCNASK